MSEERIRKIENDLLDLRVISQNTLESVQLLSQTLEQFAISANERLVALETSLNNFIKLVTTEHKN